MAPFFTGTILLLDIEHYLFRAINCSYVTSRDQYQALRLATVVYVMKSTPLRHVFDNCWKFYPKSNSHGRRGHGGLVDWSLMGTTVFLMWM